MEGEGVRGGAACKKEGERAGVVGGWGKGWHGVVVSYYPHNGTLLADVRDVIRRADRVACQQGPDRKTRSQVTGA